VDQELATPDDFGGWLRTARERSGVTLEDLAQRTKVSGSRIRALERNDLSTWPGGIFRRGFVRSYAEHVGLDPDETVERFVQTFPETDDGTPGRVMPAVAGDPTLRLLLAEEAEGWRPVFARVGAAATDCMAPIVLALPSGLFGGTSLFWIVLAVFAVLYVTAGTLILGTTPGLRLMQRATSRPSRSRHLNALRSVTRPMTNVEDEAAIEREVSHAHR
jgi:transcriptional regulator with XRE-family HTH domain